MLVTKPLRWSVHQAPSEPLQTVATAVTFSTTPNYTKKICMTHDISFCFFLGSYFHPGLNAPKKSLNRAVLHTSTSCLLCTTLFRVFENHRKYLIVKYLDFQAKNTNISKVSTIVQCTCMITVQFTLWKTFRTFFTLFKILSINRILYRVWRQ